MSKDRYPFIGEKLQVGTLAEVAQKITSEWPGAYPEGPDGPERTWWTPASEGPGLIGHHWREKGTKKGDFAYSFRLRPNPGIKTRPAPEDFKVCLPLEEFRNLAIAVHDGNGSGSNEILRKAIRRFLTANRLSGIFRNVEMPEGRIIPFGIAWNRFLSAKSKSDQEITDLKLISSVLAEIFSYDSIVSLNRGERSRQINGKVDFTEPQIRKAYRSLIETVGTGVLPKSSKLFLDLNTGDTFRLQSGGWDSFEFGHYDETSYAWVPLGPAHLRQTAEISVNFPTGELLISDWFALDAFNNRICPPKTADEEREHTRKYKDVKSVEGLINQVTLDAQNHNIFSLPITSSHPEVFLVKDMIAIGVFPKKTRPERFPQEIGLIGSFQSDFGYNSTLTIIDKQDLYKILSSESGSDEAKVELDTYLEEQGEQIRMVKIPAGAYDIRFSTNTDSYFVPNEDVKIELIGKLNTFATIRPTSKQSTML